METRIDIALAMDVFGEAPELPDPLPTHTQRDVPIINGLFIGPVEHRGEIIEACDPRGISWNPPTRQYGSQYGIWCDVEPGTANQFDVGDRLGICIQLSRLVHPTGIDFRFAGRLSLRDDGTIAEFVPGRVRADARPAYVADPTTNWLSDSHIDELRQLLLAFQPKALGVRLTRALFYHEYLHRLYYVGARWPMATTGIEALIHTDKYRSTAQFVHRAMGLQKELGINVATESDLRDIYDLRSRLAHGHTLGDLGTGEMTLYMALEQILRTSIRRGIEDAKFAAFFKSDDTVRSRWPLP